MFKKSLLFFPLFIIVGCSGPATDNTTFELTQEAPSSNGGVDLNLDVKKTILDNGMTLLHLKNSKLPIVSMYTFYDIGGRYETPGVTGSTHFLEHMMFKKTKNNPAEYFSKIIEESGGNTNAYTTFDNTVYYQNIPVSKLEEVLGLEAERMQFLELEEEPFEQERKVVLEERKMRYENKAGGQLYLRMMQEMFVKTPYGGSVIGAAKDVLGLSRKRMMEFYNTFYKPNNAIMVVVGDVEHKNLVKLVNEKFSKIPKSEKLQEIKAGLDNLNNYKFQAKLPKTVEIKGESETPMFMMAYPSVSVGNKDGYALDLLAKVLGEGASSHLNKKFVISKKPQLSSISADNYSLKNSGVFYFAGQLLDRVNYKKFKADFTTELTRVCDNAIDERSVQKTKNSLLLELYAALETNDGLAGFIGNSEFFYGDYNAYKKELEIYNSLTSKEVRDVCYKYLSPKNALFVSVWKNNK